MKNSRENNTKEKKKFVAMEKFSPMRSELKKIREIDESITKLEQIREAHCNKLRPAIRTFRLASGMSSMEIGKILGITQGHFADIERGRRSCTPGVISKLYDWAFPVKK